LPSAGSFIGLFFDPEEGGFTVLRTVGEILHGVTSLKMVVPYGYMVKISVSAI
jgi:hypothetical protein